MSITRGEFFDLVGSLQLLMTEIQTERLYEALSARCGWDAKPGQTIVAAYCEAFTARYGAKFKPSPAEAKRLKDFAKSEGQDRAAALVWAYFKMNDQWFVQKGHPISVFLADLNKVRIFLDSGKAVTQKDAARLEDRQGWANLVEGE